MNASLLITAAGNFQKNSLADSKRIGMINITAFAMKCNKYRWKNLQNLAFKTASVVFSQPKNKITFFKY